MKRNSCIRNRLKKWFPSNPLSYIGWLGILGIIGIFFAPIFSPFLLFFSFFPYTKMEADELFWENVRKASTRRFWTTFTVMTITMLVLLTRGICHSWFGDEVKRTVIRENSVTMGIFTYEQYMIVFLLMFLSMTLMISVFSISMFKFRKEEKKTLEKVEE